MVYEDGIPIQSLISDPMIFGGDLYSAPGDRVIGKVATSCSAVEYNNSSDKGKGHYNNGLKDNDNDNIWFDYLNNGSIEYSEYYYGAVIESSDTPTYD